MKSLVVTPTGIQNMGQFMQQHMFRYFTRMQEESGTCMDNTHTGRWTPFSSRVRTKIRRFPTVYVQTRDGYTCICWMRNVVSGLRSLRT
jgi:hypothetical protein